jgi:hypothetical protein
LSGAQDGGRESVLIDLEELREHLLAECREDEVGLWYITKGVRDLLGTQDPAELRRITLHLVRELLQSGEVIAGWYAPSDSGLPHWRIVSWPGSIEEILDRINTEWDHLGREPNVGEIVILQAKDERPPLGAAK